MELSLPNTFFFRNCGKSAFVLLFTLDCQYRLQLNTLVLGNMKRWSSAYTLIILLE